jgi:hypothetical protein
LVGVQLNRIYASRSERAGTWFLEQKVVAIVAELVYNRNITIENSNPEKLQMEPNGATWGLLM